MEKRLLTITAACVIATVFASPIIGGDKNWWKDNEDLITLNNPDLIRMRDESNSLKEFTTKIKVRCEALENDLRSNKNNLDRLKQQEEKIFDLNNFEEMRNARRALEEICEKLQKNGKEKTDNIFGIIDKNYASYFEYFERNHKELYQASLDKAYYEDLQAKIKNEANPANKKALQDRLDKEKDAYKNAQKVYDEEYKKLNAEQKKLFDALMNSPEEIAAGTPPNQNNNNAATPAAAGAGFSLAAIWAWVKNNKEYTAVGTIVTLIGAYIVYSLYKSVQEAHLQAENNEREKAILSQKIKQIDEQNRMLIEQIKKQHAEMQAEIVEKQKAAAAAAAQVAKPAPKNKPKKTRVKK